MLLDYATLKFIWWILIGVLLLGFIIMDGHDMGVGALLPFVAKKDVERRVVINTVAPHWEGNQVWFILAGGAIFAAWPYIYAVAFSGFYIAMLAVLFALFLRPVGFDYRSKIENTTWRSTWDWCLFIGGFVPPIIFGVAFGNLLLGVPFTFDNELRSTYTGGFWDLLTLFPLLCGLVSSSMIIFHGANYLLMRTDGEVAQRARRASLITGSLMLILFVAAGFWVSQLKGYTITSGALHNAAANPTLKTVSHSVGAWLNNYHTYPMTLLFPILGILGGLLGLFAAQTKRATLAFIASSVAATGILGTAGVSMFPFMLPSSLNPNVSLTVWDSGSSQLTLFLMLLVTLIFMPLIIVYTSWVYRIMRGKVTASYIKENSKALY